jgi:Membrane-bound toxin component of toxin-antitoxin system
VLIRPSPLGAALVGTLHAFAAGAVFVALPLAAAAICVLGLALSAAVLLGEMLQWRRDAVRELSLRPDGGATWRDGDGVWHVAADVSGGVVAPWLIVIGLKENGRRRLPVALLPDALEGEARRELQVWLRWRPHPRGDAPTGVI